ncbi:MAG: Gfo/Idh/MocA family protein [Acidimicrobiales bacterium]
MTPDPPATDPTATLPAASDPAASDPAATDPLRWGVLGATSTVARAAVLPALRSSPTARLVAVASLSKAPGTYDGFGAARALATYEEVLADPDVEAVYVPLPNSLHRPWVIAAAAAGRHVLCEKPLATSQPEAELIAGACEAAGVVLMEAYMTPFHPRSAAMAALVAGGRLGELRFAHAAFTGVLSSPDDHRWRPEMGGGALLDLGVYCLAPILAAAGRPPRSLAASATLTTSGVDASFSGWLDMGEGLAGAIECSFEATERQHLEVVGTNAAANIHMAFTPGPGDTGIKLRHRDGSTERIEAGGADPYLGMVEHFADVIRGRATMSRGPAASASLAGVLDDLAVAAGLRSPRPC